VFLADLSRQHNLEQAAHLFLGSLSHELRTPLTAMLTHLEVLRTPEIPEAVRQNSLSLMHQETRRIAKLVEGLVDLNRLQITPEVSEQPLDLLLVAEEAIAEIILEAEARQIQVSLEAGAPLPRVRGDPDRLKQVFLNVLDNAVKYCRAHDKVEVSLKSLPEGVSSTILDTGPGISPEDLPFVIQRLYRARTDVSGSGLGLALAEEILRHHHSRLEIQSRYGEKDTGTTVSFLLPAIHAA